MNKLNPMLYHEDKRSKRLQREEDHAKHKLTKSNYIKMLQEEASERPQEIFANNKMG